jgi:hypothetical protein
MLLSVPERAKSGEPFRRVNESLLGVARTKREVGEKKRNDFGAVALAAQCLINGSCLGRVATCFSEVAIDKVGRSDCGEYDSE